MDATRMAPVFLQIQASPIQVKRSWKRESPTDMTSVRWIGTEAGEAPEENWSTCVTIIINFFRQYD